MGGVVSGVSRQRRVKKEKKKKDSLLKQKPGLEKHHGWPFRYTGQKWEQPAGSSATIMRQREEPGPDIQSSTGGTVARSGHNANTVGTFQLAAARSLRPLQDSN